MQLQYQVTTTQPAPAGVFINQNQSQSLSSINCPTPVVSSYSVHPQTASSSSNIFSNNSSNTCGDVSPVSSTGSFSSADTNQTLLNTIIHKQQPKATVGIDNQITTSGSTVANSLSLSGRSVTSNNRSSRSYQTKYGQFMIVTPAVSIDRDFGNESNQHQGQHSPNSGSHQQRQQHLQAIDNDAFNASDDDRSFIRSSSNSNLYKNLMLHSTSSVDSGNSSDSGSGSGSGSFRSAYNPYLHTSRQHLLPKSAPPFCTFSQSTWRWCTLLCAAMRCFGTGTGSTDSGHSSFIRPPYYRSHSTGLQNPLHSSGGTKTLHRRLRSYSTTSFTPETAFEHFSAPFKSRKNRDQLNNNITYEL